MIKDLELPDLGEGIDGAEISEIPVSVGDEITKDQTILILESDKASMEIPSDFTGTLKEILVSTGDEVSTGQLLMKIDSSDESSDQDKKEDETTITYKKHIKKEIISFFENKFGAKFLLIV